MNLVSLGIDLVAIVLLAFGIYFQRYRRREVMVAMIGLNVAVVAVSAALSSASVGLGLGLGLFGVLSIIRLRSSELSHSEVAYYFVSLAMGLLAGLAFDPTWLGQLLIGLLVVVMFLADHPALFRGYRHQVLTLDRAITDEKELQTELATLLGAEIKQFTVQRVDQVRDTTLVDVRYRVRNAAPLARDTATEPTAHDALAN
ncbi:DUF4956 domain-containing protein [Micropruina glycogenica]|jgi:uncharacterized protein DUF4956|uniref:Permease n=1 Tax=Micropruina glycogenica TaxID=75385 RepID=A0A2N9JCA0_9ACTN|nr:DUF4956 domain-containing protein [Micropruina glycogenica]SPD85757.1 conserved membrane protein of unknown function [Micropruina glycogenica]